MISAAQVREWALALPGTEEKPHFEKAAFRTKKGIFCSLSEQAGTAVLKLNLVDQSVFGELGVAVCHPVPGKWGLTGYTVFVLAEVEEGVFRDALGLAYGNV